jgi:anhydro-N-acetylmuramic acid kinase
MEPIWAVGLMTGTVLDGNIDVALLRTDGESVTAFGAYRLAPYPPGLREMLERTLAEARVWAFEGPEPAIFAEAEAALTHAQAEAVRDLVEGEGPALSCVGIVGLHGQTVLHRATEPGRAGRTRQLGDGALMARLLGVPVAYDFRSADVAAGGQGAPLCAIYHAALLRQAGLGPDTAVLNLGGVANVTWADGQGGLVAFDTGPANAPLNDWVAQHGLGAMDRDGALARSGRVDEAQLARLLEHPWLARPYPKSLDRFDFPAAMAEGLAPADGAALLTAFTAAAVGRGLELLPVRPRRLVVCGGGRRNPAIMAALAARAGVEVVPAEELGWRGDAVEAECFALLAVRTLRGLPISFPGTTGAPGPLPGGRVARPKPATEAASARFAGIETWNAADLVAGLTGGQFAAIGAVQAAAPSLTQAIDAMADRLAGGAGRIVTLGAGTSGRIATQDAVELRPTFDWPAERTLTLMAGGPEALTAAREGAEDQGAEAVAALDAHAVGPADVVIGVAASGTTPFTLAGLCHARSVGALTIAVFNSPRAPMADAADHPILLDTGAEFVAGSTRLGAGTAQKAALNVLSTGAMIRLGYVWRGKMVEMRPTNAKLRARAEAMVAELTGTDAKAARAALDVAGGTIKLAVVMLARGLDRTAAEAHLARHHGSLARAMAAGA